MLRVRWRNNNKNPGNLETNNNNINNRLFMAPHLRRAQSTYKLQRVKDIRIRSFHHAHIHTQTHTKSSVLKDLPEIYMCLESIPVFSFQLFWPQSLICNNEKNWLIMGRVVHIFLYSCHVPYYNCTWIMMNSSGKEGQGVIGLPKLLIPTESAIHKFLFVLLLGFKTLQH